MKISKQIASIDFAAALRSLPPASIALRCATPHQQERMQVMIEHYRDLEADFSNFWGLRKRPKMGAKQAALIGAERRYYFALYSLLYTGFEALEAAAAKEWGVVGKQLSPWGCYEFPESPGDALGLAIALDFEASMLVALEGGSISVKEGRRALGENPKIVSGGYAAERCDRISFVEWTLKSLAKRTRGNPDLKQEISAFRTAHKHRNRALKKLLVGVRGEKWAEGSVRRN